MSTIDQSNRRIQIKADFSPNLLATDVIGTEGFSQLFHYRCEILSTNLSLTAQDVIGKNVGLTIMQYQQQQLSVSRYVHGMVKSFITTDEVVTYTANEMAMRRYYVELAPNLYLLTLSKHCRVFQKKNQTLIDIVKNVLQFYNIDIDNKVSSPPVIDYCMQYNESDFDFISRLLADAGIFYYFQHQASSHQLILSNQTSAYLNTDPVQFGNGGIALDSFSLQTQLVAAKEATDDYDIAAPRKQQYGEKPIAGILPVSGMQKPAINYSYPSTLGIANKTITLQAAAESVGNQSQLIIAETDYPLQIAQLTEYTGNTFTSLTVPKTVITQFNWQVLDKSGLIDHEQNNAISCKVNFTAMPAQAIFRPAKLSAPQSPGLQIATVVGSDGNPAGSQPFYYDDYGRLCIKFVWEGNIVNELEQKTNYFDQCTVNVLHSWDNGVYRVGTPVLVDFINQDPNRPVIIGAINNANNLLLGKFSTQTATQSILQRMPGVDKKENYNSILFDDQGDKGQLTITATNDLITISKNESFKTKQHQHNVDETYQLTAKQENYQSKNVARKVDEEYQLSAKQENYQSKGCQRKVDGQYQLTANAIVLKGNLSLSGNLTLDGNLKISGSVDVA